MEIQDSLPFGFEDTSFQAAGGIEGIHQLVRTFYYYMEILPEAKNLRAMHSNDLTVSIDKLGRFLCGWLGGPKLYKEKYGAINIPQAHQRFTITEEDVEAWLLCMQKAIAKQPYSAKFSTYLIAQLRVPATRILQASKNATK